MDNPDQAREAQARKTLQQQTQRAIKVRDKDREFHGLEREFLYAQAQMVQDYERSKSVHHPRDVGDIREDVLFKFLKSSGYLPARYGVRKRVRIAATSGHVTGEMDIVIHDALDTISLMRREEVFEVLPVESVYGVIQVKSKLTATELEKAMDNIAVFKQLVRDVPGPGLQFNSPSGGGGFGLIFAYDTGMEWKETLGQVETYAKANKPRLWANAVFILNHGLILHANDSTNGYQNRELEAINTLTMHGFPDRQGIGLYTWYTILLNLLRATPVLPANPDAYLRLPLVADSRSYEFCLGSCAEVGHCAKHGDFQRVITPQNLDRLISWCGKEPPINFWKAMDLAEGGAGDRTEIYERQPYNVVIYNPEKLELKDILLEPSGAVACDQLRIGQGFVCVPYYYSVKEGVISGCPKCARKKAAKK